MTMWRNWRSLVALAGLIAPMPNSASASESIGFRTIAESGAVRIQANKSYVAFSVESKFSGYSLFVLRIPSPNELEAFNKTKREAFEKVGKKVGSYESFVFAYSGEPNLYAIPIKKPKQHNDAQVMAELQPGEYVLYGLGWRQSLYQCFCFGSVRFSLPAGQVTDLGTVLLDTSWELSPIPELVTMSNLGRIGRMDYGQMAVGLRPRNVGGITISGVEQRLVHQPQFHAIGPFLETNTILATRLAPISDILAYDGHRVIDVASGEEALPEIR